VPGSQETAEPPDADEGEVPMIRPGSTVLRIGCALVLAVGATLTSAAPSSASVVHREKYTETFTDTFNACGTRVLLEETVSGTLMIKQHGDEVVPYVHDRFFGRQTITNLKTGRSFSTSLRNNHVDVKITHVRGTIYRFTWIDAGPFTVYDGDGRVAHRIAGNLVTTALIDTKGNSDPSDDEWLSVSTEERGHWPELDFCADVRAFTT
jgi:hypothetical protein